MRKPSLSLLAAACCVFVSTLTRAQYADSVVAYSPGTGANNYTNSSTTLGEPSRETVDPQFGAFPVDPFGPPYLTNQIVSLGAGGSLTLGFGAPVANDPANPYGMDLIVFGNAFFQFNPDFTTTSGALGGNNSGVTAVYVSADNVNFYRLNPALTLSIDDYFPTDGSGDFTQPVNPGFNGGDFNGRDLAGIRALYGGSGGGTPLDISQAQDINGDPVNLPGISFIRFDQLSGVAQIDAVSDIMPVPEPAAWILGLTGAALLWVKRGRRQMRRGSPD